MLRPTNHNKGYAFNEPKEVTFYGHSNRPGAPLQVRSFKAKKSQLANPKYEVNYKSLLQRHAQAIAKRKPFEFFRLKDTNGHRIPVRAAYHLNALKTRAKRGLKQRVTERALNQINEQDIDQLLAELQPANNDIDDLVAQLREGTGLKTIYGTGMKGGFDLKKELAKRAKSSAASKAKLIKERVLEIKETVVPQLHQQGSKRFLDEATVNRAYRRMEIDEKREAKRKRRGDFENWYIDPEEYYGQPFKDDLKLFYEEHGHVPTVRYRGNNARVRLSKFFTKEELRRSGKVLGK